MTREQIHNTERASRMQKATEGIDFLILAPLEEERDAILSKLPGREKLDADGVDSLVYFRAELPTRRKDKAVYRLIVTSPTSMGPTQAAIAALTAVQRWQPEHVLLAGIAGGLAGEVSLGDVMIGGSLADYTIGKVYDDGTREERWEQHPADPVLLNAANAFRTGWEDLLTESRPGKAGRPMRYAGVIASGGDVIASCKLIAAYRKDMPKLIGVEMEGGGVAAALHSHKRRPRFLMIRGVSDLADGEGNAATKKRWRAYARDVAAAYAIGFLREGPVPATEKRTRSADGLETFEPPTNSGSERSRASDPNLGSAPSAQSAPRRFLALRNAKKSELLRVLCQVAVGMTVLLRPSMVRRVLRLTDFYTLDWLWPLIVAPVLAALTVRAKVVGRAPTWATTVFVLIFGLLPAMIPSLFMMYYENSWFTGGGRPMEPSTLEHIVRLSAVIAVIATLVILGRAIRDRSEEDRAAWRRWHRANAAHAVLLLPYAVSILCFRRWESIDTVVMLLAIPLLFVFSMQWHAHGAPMAR